MDWGSRNDSVSLLNTHGGIPVMWFWYSQTSLIRTSLIRMIRNPNTFSWERFFIVLFVLLNPDVSVSGSGQAWFQQTFLVFNSDELIRTPTTLSCSCVTQADLGAWRLGNNYRRWPGARWGRGWQRGVAWAKHEAWQHLPLFSSEWRTWVWVLFFSCACEQRWQALIIIILFIRTVKKGTDTVSLWKIK